ncbi:hypothetical protein PANO111632_10965 [Paracoccus nototheniae]|uniref:Uncharacterized protein n=1 Tax=Paracoccus nototheniae TaxID=2489002 RepID=A0ABW4E2N6_9RHOB|nr:hypothetical protein [Paracoccus nototheniae]
MFSDWKQEKTIAALVDEAQALADKLDGAKPHIVDSHAAAVQFWAARYLADGQDLHDLPTWKPQAATRFAAALQVRIAALRKARAYDSSDGLAIWLHTARAVSEPRIVPPLRQIWQHVMEAGSNADIMAEDLLQEEGLPPGPGRRAPVGFGLD